MTRTANYARVSSQAQAGDDKVSIDEQITEMDAYCERKGYEVVARFQDIGSGTSKSRPAFLKMLDEAQSGAFDTIVCWKSDRLSRGIYPAAAILEVVEQAGIALEAVADTIDMKLFGIYAAIGKIEIDNFRERSTLGKRGVAKRGRIPVGTVPYGYRISEQGFPEVEPNEAPVVRRIFDDYVNQGKGAHVIARELTEEHVPLRKASRFGAWAPAHVLRLMTNEAYVGSWQYGRTRNVSTDQGRRVFPRPRDEWISVPFPPLVDHETFERVKTLKRSRSQLAKRNTKETYPLQGLLHCEDCGLRFAVRTNRRNLKRKNGRTYRYDYSEPKRYYSCYGMRRHRLKCRERAYLPAADIEDLVWSEVTSVLRRPEVIVAGMSPQAAGRDREKLDEDIASAEREVRKVEEEEDRAVRLYVSGKITEAQLGRQRRFITERLEHAQKQLDNLRGQRQAHRGNESLSEAILAWTKQVETGLSALSAVERQELLRLVLDRVSIDRAGAVTITLAIPADEFMSNAEPDRSCWWRR